MQPEFEESTERISRPSMPESLMILGNELLRVMAEGRHLQPLIMAARRAGDIASKTDGPNKLAFLSRLLELTLSAFVDMNSMAACNDEERIARCNAGAQLMVTAALLLGQIHEDNPTYGEVYRAFKDDSKVRALMAHKRQQHEFTQQEEVVAC